jgi:hypothetical protein
MGASVIHTDEYVTAGDASLPYPERLTYSRILSAVNSAVASSPVTIVEGICLREVLRRSTVAANVFVYVKSVAANGLWDDGFHLEDFQTEGAMPVNLEEPHWSDFTYHAAVRPHERADIMFHRLEAQDEA